MKEKKEKTRLNIKQLAFIDNLFSGMSNYKAYIASGYKAKKESVARADASRLLTNANISAEVERRKKEIIEQNMVRLLRMSETALKELFEIAKDGSEKKGQLDACNSILDRAGLKAEDMISLQGREPIKVIFTYE